MLDWDIYNLDCDLTDKEPTIIGFIWTEAYLLIERIGETFFPS
jgi:hypothetical protein